MSAQGCDGPPFSVATLGNKTPKFPNPESGCIIRPAAFRTREHAGPRIAAGSTPAIAGRYRRRLNLTNPHHSRLADPGLLDRHRKRGYQKAPYGKRRSYSRERRINSAPYSFAVCSKSTHAKGNGATFVARKPMILDSSNF